MDKLSITIISVIIIVGIIYLSLIVIRFHDSGVRISAYDKDRYEGIASMSCREFLDSYEFKHYVNVESKEWLQIYPRSVLLIKDRMVECIP